MTTYEEGSQKHAAELATPRDVLDYWFDGVDERGTPDEAASQRWFGGSATIDDEIRERFGTTVASALDGGLAEWEHAPRSRLALVIVLDQFPRNLFRGDGQAFSGDDRAFALASATVENGEDRLLRPVERRFLYLPFEHREEIGAQRRCCALHAELLRDALGAEASFEGALEWARRHEFVIARFGRFPSRNEALGRESTAEERRFLEETPIGF